MGKVYNVLQIISPKQNCTEQGEELGKAGYNFKWCNHNTLL